MKNYNKWTNASDDGFDNLYDLYEKDTIRLNDTVNVECVVDNANEWQENVDYIFLVKKDKGTVNYGDYVQYNSLNYVVNFAVEDREYYWAAKSRLCNNILTITTESTKTIVGHDSLNRPIYDVIPGDTLLYPCIVQSLTNYYSGTSQAINVPEGRILISISNTTNSNVAVGKKFTIFNTDYRINALDRSKTLNDKGILDIIADKITD